MHLGSRLKHIRKSKKVSLRELSEGIDKHITQITRWEDDDNNSVPSVEDAFKIAEFLKVDIYYLVFGESKEDSKVDTNLKEQFTEILSLPETNKQSILELIKVIVSQHSK